MKAKKKRIPNKARKIPDGTILSNWDSHLPGGNRSRHIAEEAKHPGKLYRHVLVIDTNRDNDLAIVEFTSKGNVKIVGKTTSGKEYVGHIAPIVHVQDAKGHRLRRIDKILVTDRSIIFNLDDVRTVKRDVLDPRRTKYAKRNKIKIKTMKNRVYKKKKGS